MYSVNGVPLDNAMFGWILRAPTEPLSSFTFDRASMERAGRDGVVAGLPATTGPVSLRFMVQTPRANLETLIAVFAAGGVLAMTANTGREVSYETLSHTPTGHGPADAVVDATFLIRLPSVFWRDKTESTTTGALTSASVPVKVFGSAPVAGAVPVARNLATHGSFELPGSAVEVVRSYFNPALLNTLGMGATVLAGGATRGFSLPVTPGEVYSIRRKAPLTARFRYVFTASAPAGGVSYFGGSGNNPTYDAVEAVENITVPASATHMFVYLSNSLETVPGLLIVKAATVGPYWDAAGPSPDPDLTAGWSGAVNASDPILSGVAAAGVNGLPGAGRTVIQSAAWSADGVRSLRINATDAPTLANGAIVTPAGLVSGNTYTAVARLRLDAPQSGSASSARRIFLLNGVMSDQAPNTVGVHEVRLTFVHTGVVSALRLAQGHPGDLPVRWDSLTVVDGVYAGPPFNANTPATSSRVYLWDGAPDGSTTSAWDRASINGGISAPVADAVIRVQGAAGGIQITDSSGAWASLPTVTAGQWVRFECATGRAFITTSDVWTGGTEVSGLVDFGGPRGVFEITPVLTPGDPSTRFGQVTVTTTSRSGASVAVRGKAAYTL